MRTDAKLDREVADIGGLSRQELVDAWINAHGTPPPKGIKRPLLELSAGWHLQTRRLGGLPAASRKALLRAAQTRPTDGSPKPYRLRRGAAAEVSAQTDEPVRIALVPGSRLMREWNGQMYAVDVTVSGFVLDGKTYRSLSAIARRITGARWSGPRFFGL